MSASPIITLGYGATFGLPALIITLGYGLGATPPPTPTANVQGGPGDGSKRRKFDKDFMRDFMTNILLLDDA